MVPDTKNHSIVYFCYYIWTGLKIVYERHKIITKTLKNFYLYMKVK